MKNLIIALALLMPTLSWAGCNSDQNTVRTIENGVETISKQSQVTCREGNRDVFSDCELYQWQHNWGKGSAVSCNWTEKQAMNTALAHAPDGLKVEWYDNVSGQKGYTVVAWTRPLSDQGICRDIELVKYSIGMMDKKTYIMCQSRNGTWQAFRSN
jgi:hypothetical protein